MDELAAKCADACNLFVGPLDPTTPAAATIYIEHMKPYADIGISEVRVMPMQDLVRFIKDLGTNVVPAIAKL